MPALPADQLRELEQVAVSAAVAAARFIAESRPAAVAVSTTKTSDLDVVTAMDTASERQIRATLARLRPADGVLGEEAGGQAGSSELTWVVDPIDGTVNYLYDLPAYAVSVAVVRGDPSQPGHWEPLAGAVVNPRVGEVFSASLGGGARWRPLDSAGEPGAAERLQVTSVSDLAAALVGTGFSYDRSQRDLQGRVAHRVLEQVRDLRRMGSAALDLCSVAAGRLDGYYELGLQPWDLAAGWLVVTEAGGQVSGLDGPPSGDMVLAAGPALHPQLRRLVAGLHEA